MAEQDNPMQGVITKCWEDEAFKARLLAEPAATLAAEGVQIPAGMTVNVAVDSKDVRTMVIPLPPTADLSDAELDVVVAGAGGWAEIANMTIPVAQAPVSHEWCARRLPRLRRPRRLRRPGGMSQIGKIRKGPFLILPICTTPPGGACGGRGGHGAMSAFSRPSIRRLNAQPEGRGWSR